MGINKNGTVYYVHNDHLNTPTINKIREFETFLKFSYFVIYQVTNSNNAVVFDWPAVDPFGANQPITNTIDFNIRYPGQYYDSETAYHYNYHRYYNPSTGKYLQADPIGLAGGYNLYNYVDNNSLSGIDPEGLLKIFLGNPKSAADILMYNAYLNDPDDPNRIIIYGHGNTDIVVISKFSPVKKPQLTYDENGEAGVGPLTLTNILKMNGVDTTKYQSIELKACDTGMNTYAQEFANYTGLKVSAPPDYYLYRTRFGGWGPVGTSRSVGPIKSDPSIQTSDGNRKYSFGGKYINIQMKEFLPK